MGVRLTMSSSAPPQTGRIEPVRILDDAGGIVAAKEALVDSQLPQARKGDSVNSAVVGTK